MLHHTPPNDEIADAPLLVIYAAEVNIRRAASEVNDCARPGDAGKKNETITAAAP
jgi:hypothetical protein